MNFSQSERDKYSSGQNFIHTQRGWQRMNSVAGCAWNGLRNNARSVLNKEMSSCWTSQKRWATKRSGGSTKNGRDSISKRLGVKRFGG